MRTHWTVRVYISKASYWEWEHPTQQEASDREKSIRTLGFHCRRAHGRGRRHYLPAAILFIDIIPPAKSAEVPA